MESCILYIGKLDLSSWTSEIVEFVKEQSMIPEFLVEQNLDAAYNHLFSRKIGLVILDSDSEGIEEVVSMFKAEDMLRHIPVLVIIHDNSLESEKSFLLAGADQVVGLSKVESGMLFAYVRPLVLSNKLMAEKISKTSVLQEKAINDFILLDLIKAYIPKTIWRVAQECAHMQKIKLPEEEREQTIVFGDIKGFTKMSQHLPPKEVVAILNEVYEVVTRHIYTHNGDVDKFVGDAFFGIFNSAADAVRSMVLIQKELEEINERRESEGSPIIQFRIGIHTGPVIRGNVGGHKRYDNTLIGDTVNTASRLEHISPVGDVIISEDTRIEAGLEIPDEFQSSEFLRGRDCEIKVYTVYNLLKDDTEFLNNDESCIPIEEADRD